LAKLTIRLIQRVIFEYLNVSMTQI